MRIISFARHHALLFPILLLAVFLRIYEADTEFFGGDDAYISIKAIQIARYGETHLLGPPSSLGLVHSPLSVYLYAIPYLFSPDPRGAQVFTGLVNTVAVVLVYLISHRYFGRWAAILGSILYAVHPHMVFASRVINNAQLGAPLVMLYVFTGLLGYYNKKAWARLAHLPLLSLAGQCHPHSFALAPISLALLIYDWIDLPRQRRAVLLQTVASACIAAVTMLPWGIGVYQFSQHVDLLETVQNMPATGELQESVRFGGLGHILSLAYDLERVPSNWLRPVQAVITVTGAAWLLSGALQNRKKLPGLIIVLGLIIVPAVTWIIQAHWVVDYWWPSLPSAFIIQGAFLGAVVALPKTFGRVAYPFHLLLPGLKWLALLLAVALFANQVSDYIFTDHPPPPVSAYELVSTMDVAVDQAKDENRELLVMLSPGHRGLTWAFLREYAFLKHGLDAALVQPDRAIPLPYEGAVLVGEADNKNRDSWFADGERMPGRARLAKLPPAEHFIPDMLALHPFRFSNGVIVHGFYSPDAAMLPRAGEHWTTIMIWQAEGGTPQDFKVFTHLIAADGHKYAQADRRGLATEQWAPGGFYASQFDLDLSDDLPETGELFLRFGMYSDEGQVDLLDTVGNSTDHPGIIQIRAERSPVAVWHNGLQLRSFVVSSPVQSGPTINASATWYATHDLPEKLQINWRVFDNNDSQVYSTITDIVSDMKQPVWPQGVFATETYELWVPSDIAPGEYHIDLQLVSHGGQSLDEPFVTTMEVTARDRAFSAPPLLHDVRATFGGEIEILGYELDHKKASIEIILYWRALGYVPRDYKYFVHLWQGDTVVAQVDSMPADWEYPTSWWAPGEVVSQHVLFDVGDLDSGDFGLTTGFYDPADGERLSVVLQGEATGDVSWVTLIEALNE
ncbi:MAG: glycosyltransferase family 39 protein [Anaerolineales bacterium]|nr:glycosyltransferase family 39 protein [Anaerolineales bacterium]